MKLGAHSETDRKEPLKYGWSEEQRKVFDKFVEERYANYRNPENTLCSYLDLLNQLVLDIKKPFSDITYEDLIPLLIKWQNQYEMSTLHGKKNKLKAFLRWESGNKHDTRVEKIRSCRYVSPITIHDLLIDEEIGTLRKVARDDPRDLALLDFHLLWGPCPSESVLIKVKDEKYTMSTLWSIYPRPRPSIDPFPFP